MNVTTDPTSATAAAIRSAVVAAIPGAEVEVSGQGDHFQIKVVSATFAGRSKVDSQRTVYRAIQPLLSGPNPAVHAVDRLETVAPEAAAEHRVITITPTAEEQVRRLIAAEGRPGLGLRLGIRGGGCSGLSYDLEFSERRDGDTVVPFPGFEVFLDRKSVIYLADVTLDFQGGLSGRGFVFANPHATNTCGCGESFSL